MFVRLNDLIVELKSDDDGPLAQWRSLFDLEISGRHESVHVSITAKVRQTVPAPPQQRPVFVDPVHTIGGQPYLSVFEHTDAFQLFMPERALVTIDLAPQAVTKYVEIYLSPHALRDGSLEDLTMLALAPILRRQGTYFLHASAAKWNRRTLLLVGPSQSGKTTTCLGLALNEDWRYLANDNVLLYESKGKINAHPTPGWIHTRPKTLQLLPELRKLVTVKLPSRLTERLFVSRRGLNPSGLPSAAPVSSIIFPIIAGGSNHQIRAMSSAECLARLLEESADRWDSSLLDEHIAFLSRLATQAHAFELHLGQDIQSLPPLLSRHL